MKFHRYPEQDAIKHYFPLPNEIFCLGLCSGEIAVYTGLVKRPEFQADSHLFGIDYRTNSKNRYHRQSITSGIDWERFMNTKSLVSVAKSNMYFWSSNEFLAI